MKFPVLGEAKEKMKACEYRAVLDLCAALPEAALDDEISMIEARSAFRAAEEEAKATVFGYWVSDPERYGVAEFDDEGNCISIINIAFYYMTT